ncbi:ribosome-associated GTPase EngA [archaeon]|nr:MAG: ribosome-associated GTPase EngA [archaeon]
MIGIRRFQRTGANYWHGVRPCMLRQQWFVRSFSTIDTLSVALVGRPNTGKSTLFNRLTKTRSAIVSNIPGTTRDRKEGMGNLAGLQFKVTDTGGFDDRGAVSVDIQTQVELAVKTSDIVLLMIDTKVGVTALDKQFAKWLRMRVGSQTSHKPTKVILIANKAEGGYMSDSTLNIVAEGYQLGFGEPLLISAAHGDGLADLATRLIQVKEQKESTPPLPTSEESSDIPASDSDVIQLAVMGRPNVGKSTLLNAMIGEQRVIAGPMPGLTRDAITIDWSFNDRQFRLVDTAGLTRIRTDKGLLAGVQERHLQPIHETLGKDLDHVTIKLPGKAQVDIEADPSQYSAQISEFALISALNALRFAQVVLLVIEADQGAFKKIDLQLARKCLEEGRALFIAANKCDVIKARGMSMNEYEEQVRAHTAEYFREFGDIPVIATSGTESLGIKRLLRTTISVYDSWNRRISTGMLNTWLKDTMVTAPTARAGERAVKIKYMTQIKARPPTFALFTNVSELPGFFERYMRSKIQEDFKLVGVPIRFVVKKTVGSAPKLALLRHGKHSKRGAGMGDSRGRVGPNRDKVRLIKRITQTTLERRKRDKRLRSKRSG